MEFTFHVAMRTEGQSTDVRREGRPAGTRPERARAGGAGWSSFRPGSAPGPWQPAARASAPGSPRTSSPARPDRSGTGPAPRGPAPPRDRGRCGRRPSTCAGRADGLVVVQTEVVDAGLGDDRRVLPEVGHVGAGHLEADDF